MEILFVASPETAPEAFLLVQVFDTFVLLVSSYDPLGLGKKKEKISSECVLFFIPLR